MSLTVAAHNLVFLSCMLLDKFLEKTVKITSEIVDTSDETQYKWKKGERTEEVTYIYSLTKLGSFFSVGEKKGCFSGQKRKSINRKSAL